MFCSNNKSIEEFKRILEEIKNYGLVYDEKSIEDYRLCCQKKKKNKNTMRQSTQKILLKISSIIIAIAILFFIYITIEATKQTCLGIFSDKIVCKSQRAYSDAFESCAELSWKKCNYLDKKLNSVVKLN